MHLCIIKMKKRQLEVAVISDIHLGTYGCHARELLRYLKSIDPKVLILNGDIIDIWQFSKNYWPEGHTKVLRKLMKFMVEGVEVYYLTGNHDEMLRKFSGLSLGTFRLEDKLVLELNGQKTWFFHGDIFDVTMQHSKWLARLGAMGYDSLILLNSVVNWCLTRLGREKLSFSRKIKSKIKDAVKFINRFEETAADLAIEKGYQYVVCGHIHQAEKRIIQNKKGAVTYLNSGDWVESLTALEYLDGGWTVFNYDAKTFIEDVEEEGLLSDGEDLTLKLDVHALLQKMSTSA